MIAAVGVVVPAHDEQDAIAACLASLRRSLARVPPGIATAVTVVLDRCTDATPRLVADCIADWPEAEAVVAPRRRGAAGLHRGGPGGAVGTLRALGVARTLVRLARHPVERIWLLSTDADSTVPPGWVRSHLKLAAGGAHGVAGLADLASATHLAPGALRRYQAIVDCDMEPDRHRHVYGANLGFRADAYLAVGGFPPEGPGEDHGLWRRMAAAGYRLEHPTTVRVATSARLKGRAPGGLADLLGSLAATASPPGAGGDVTRSVRARLRS